jgi:hypothetical protein
VNELQRALIGRTGVFDAVEPAQQLSVGRVQIVVGHADEDVSAVIAEAAQ